MAVAIKPFRKLQIGKQSSFGTLVAATSQVLGEWSVREISDRYRSSYPRGYNANVGAAGVDVMKGVELDVQGELSAEELIWCLQAGVKGGVTPTGPTDSAYTWTYTPQLTAAPTNEYYTFEQVESDGSTNHIAREFGDAVLNELEISASGNENVSMRHSWFARASQASTPTSAQVAIASQVPLVSNLAKVYLDTSYAGMGGTQLTTVVRSLTWKYKSPFEPKYTLDGRSDLDLTGYHFHAGFKATLDITAEIDATLATALITAWRANSLRYIRMEFTGAVIGAGSTARSIKIDGAYRFVGEPQYDDDSRTVAVSLESVYDATGGKTLEFVVVNGLSAVA